jgi:L-asparaginase
MIDTKKPKICLIYTGGTIGMRRMEDGTLKPPDDPKDFLRVAPELEDVVEFDFVDLMSKDSTNVNHHDWVKMANAVYERKDAGYKGFVIAHGTDTMHFSASAAAFALGPNLKFPVVFTGAQTIPEVQHGDARVNLLRACKVAVEDIPEVVISFGEYVFRGCRAQKKDERRFDAFESPAYFPLAYITEDIIINPLVKQSDWRTGEESILKNEFSSGVLQISLIPGLEPELLRNCLEDPKCKGVILQSFGAGNVPNEEGFSFEGIISEATNMHKPVIITSQFPANATLHTSYEPGRAAIDAGAIPTGNMTAACAVAKFRWVLAQVDRMVGEGAVPLAGRVNKVREMMANAYVGEMD